MKLFAEGGENDVSFRISHWDPVSNYRHLRAAGILFTATDDTYHGKIPNRVYLCAQLIRQAASIPSHLRDAMIQEERPGKLTTSRVSNRQL